MEHLLANFKYFMSISPKCGKDGWNLGVDCVNDRMSDGDSSMDVQRSNCVQTEHFCSGNDCITVEMHVINGFVPLFLQICSEHSRQSAIKYRVHSESE